MHNYRHKKLIDAITELGQMPAEREDFSEWIKAEEQLNFLRQNALTDELALYVLDKYAFVHSVIVPNDKLFPVDREGLLDWNIFPSSPIAGYMSGGGSEDTWIERGADTGTESLECAVQLVFDRTFEGWSGQGRNYYELNQEYAHLAEIHWRPEMRAYCRYNERGDLEAIVSVTKREDDEGVSLVSFKWETLEKYLAASKASLVRLFDFILFRPSDFNGWPSELPQEFHESDIFFYKQQVVEGHAAYTRGVQIIRPRRSRKEIFAGSMWHRQEDKEYAEFTAYDWRNQRIAKISTDPSATTNYFDAGGNSLPFEVSAAFFRPEVLSKYKTDRDKYTVSEREVSCRAAWHLQGIDVNEAGQVHAYICYLRHLPHAEQLHWLSYNEEPKASISKRAFAADIKGEWADFRSPLQEILSILRRWHENKVTWWTLRDEKLLQRVNTPLTTSRDEWGEAFMDLSKLIVEGFQTKPIRAKLDQEKIPYETKDQTLALLEKLLSKDGPPSNSPRLVGLRTVQQVRSKVKGHAGSSEGEELAQNALMEHETFGNHFQSVCRQVTDELKTIEQMFK